MALPGALVLAVTTAALWAAGGPVSIVLLMAGIGVGNALVTTSTGVHVARISRREHRGEALSLYYVATSVGCVVGPPLGFLLYGRASMAAAFMAALASLLAALGFVGMVRDDPGAGASAAPRSGWRVLSRHAFAISGVLILVTLFHSLLFAFLPLHAIKAGQGGAIGWFFAAYSGWVIGCRLAFRRLADQLGRARVVGLAIGSTGLGYLTLAAPPTVPTLLLGALVLGAGAALLYPTLVALLVDRTPEAERGLALGTLSASWDVGVPVGALLVGFTVERTSYGGGFLLGAVTTGLGLLAFGSLERRQAARRDLPRRAAGVSF